MPMLQTEHCGNWSDAELARTFAFKDEQLKKIERYQAGIIEECRLIKREIELRAIVPTVITIEGPPGGHKTHIAQEIMKYANNIGERVYLNEENGALEEGLPKKGARFHIYTKQTKVK